MYIIVHFLQWSQQFRNYLLKSQILDLEIHSEHIYEKEMVALFCNSSGFIVTFIHQSSDMRLIMCLPVNE